MTPEEAIRVLSESIHDGLKVPWDKIVEAVHLSIEALSRPSLPSNIDDASEKYACTEYPPNYEMPDDNWKQRAGYVKGFKAGVEWLTGQGVNMRGRVLPGTHINSYVESDWFDKGYGGLSWNDEVDLIILKR